MINQKEAKEATQEDYNDLVELMLITPVNDPDDWFGAFFDSIVEILRFHKEYDEDFANELFNLDTTWQDTPNTHGVYHND